MFRSKLTFKSILVLLGLISGLVWLAVFSFPDNKLHLIFCDVGQGDAILISKGFDQILIDGGPNDKVLICLRNNLPIFDRKIEIIALTHPEADHLTGLLSVLDKYEFGYFIYSSVGSDSEVYNKFSEKLKAKSEKPKRKTQNFKIINSYSGGEIKLGEIVLDTWWPEREWVAEKLGVDARGGLASGQGLPLLGNDYTNYQGDDLTASDDNSNILGFSSTNLPLNQFSLILLLSYRGKKVLLMGDGDSKIQKNIMENNTLLPIDILKFPHHGSKTGMTREFLKLIQPKEAVISVGKNSYGHPASETLDMLKEEGVKARRTDLEGDIKYNF